MARKKRQKSGTGIYHVMLRGINKQNIFFCDDDFVKMMYIIHDAQFKKDMRGKVIASDVCTVYAYCILHNHLHILLGEGTDDVSTIMKKIEDRYAAYYNLKYERVGHLFQGRFPSEPVNDAEYFHRLLRYIHRNSVKAMEANTPEEYPYSSWNEYVGHKSNIVKVLKPSAIDTVFRRYGKKDLVEWVGMDIDDKCMDMASFYAIKSDKEAFDILSDISGMKNPEDFRLLDSATQIYYLLQAIDNGISLKQAARLGTITEYQIKKAYKIKSQKLEQTIPSVVNVCDFNEKVREIKGLRKDTKSKLHRIVEYLEQAPASKCVDISSALELNQETTRRLLVTLSNEGIVVIKCVSGTNFYTLGVVECFAHGV